MANGVRHYYYTHLPDSHAYLRYSFGSFRKRDNFTFSGFSLILILMWTNSR